ncbi:MAG: hypothetical protein AAB912_03460 [Patescibacteria group bacterium]
MSTVTLPKTEYVRLQRQAQAYRKTAARFFELFLRDPIKEVVEDFQKTNLYTSAFLKDLESGLRKSSYTKRYGHKTSSKRS